ncbi:hypothetical protein ACIRPT_08495 [Streptomyces sp. NPDC101227]|uniref:hypothetical protein n=1 Tax=Streptomyces sp. NPDC101227 TaxID=3366136 RepID=UPI003813D834
MPGVLPGVEAYTVKVNAKFPGARPALRGVICLHGGADDALGEVLRGAHPGRTTAAARAVCAPVGLPWQDLALAWTAHRRAERLDIGATVDPLG